MKTKIIAQLNITADFLKKHFWPLLILSIPVVIIYEVLKITMYQLDFSYDFINYSYIIFFVNFIYSGVFACILIYSLDKMYYSISFSLPDIKEFVVEKFFLIASSVFLIRTFISIGLILFILPGIYIMGRLAISPFLLGLDKVKFINSFRLSYEYSKNNTWIIFISLLIVSIPAIFLQMVQNFVQSQITMSILSIFIYLNYILESIVIYLFYVDIRASMIKTYENQKINN